MRRHNDALSTAAAVKRHNVAMRIAARRADNLPFHT